VGNPGLPDRELRAEAIGRRVLVTEGLRRIEEELVHLGARVQHGERLARGTLLEPETAAEDLHARDHADADDGQRDGDLEQGEAAGAGGHEPASSTRTVPINGSRLTRRRSRVRSRRLETTTSAPLVLPFGKKRICRAPSPTSSPPSMRSMTAR